MRVGTYCCICHSCYRPLAYLHTFRCIPCFFRLGTDNFQTDRSGGMRICFHNSRSDLYCIWCPRIRRYSPSCHQDTGNSPTDMSSKTRICCCTCRSCWRLTWYPHTYRRKHFSHLDIRTDPRCCMLHSLGSHRKAIHHMSCCHKPFDTGLLST